MGNETTAFPEFEERFPLGEMKTASGEKISLKGINVEGDITGLIFSFSLEQEYKNETGKPLEIIYTFPLGWQTALFGMEAEIGDTLLTAVVKAKEEAEKNYEEAIDQGNSAIMLQKTGTGLYTANLGNIKPGETVRMRLFCARLLNLRQNQVRLSIPTVIAPRYGDSHSQGGLADHENVADSPAASYSFNASINVRGNLGKGEIFSPSHEIATSAIAEGVNITLTGNAWMNQDFVIIIDAAADSHAQTAMDGEAWMELASFRPEASEKPLPISIKILVDCSGSMSGSSIAQAGRGLQKILALLSPEDFASYSKFGSSVKHMTPEMLPCDKKSLSLLTSHIDATNANMGGTEMEVALLSTFRIPGPVEMPAALLLITDGDVWDVSNIIDAAKKSGHKIFVLGVGYAPGENLLQQMAEATGGSCELVTPDEDMGEAMLRMFQRMRQPGISKLKIDWQQKPLWESALPKGLYNGETLHAFALLPKQPEAGPLLSWESEGKKHSIAIGKVEIAQSPALARLGNYRRMEETPKKQERKNLALRYGFISDQTSLILVHDREGDEKIKGLPKVQHVPQMGTRGFMGSAGVMYMNSFVHSSHNFFKYAMDVSGIMDDDICPSFLKSNQDDNTQPRETADIKGQIAAVLNLWGENLYELASLAEFIMDASQDARLERIVEILRTIADDSGIPLETVWSAFISWAYKRMNELPPRHAQRLLKTAQPSLLQKRALNKRFKAELS